MGMFAGLRGIVWPAVASGPGSGYRWLPPLGLHRDDRYRWNTANRI